MGDGTAGADEGLRGARAPAIGFDVRPFREADLDAVAALWHRAMRAAYGFLPATQRHTLDEDRAYFRASIAGRCRIVVCTAGGAPLAYLALRDGDCVDRLYVDPPHQGRGIGRLLLERAAAESPAGLRLFTHVENHEARGFYEHLGFRAARFGRSPPPESAPDVEYVWRPAPGASAGRMESVFPGSVVRVVAEARRRLGERCRATYLWGSHARGEPIETSDLDVGVFVRGEISAAERERIEEEIEAAVGDPVLDFALVADADLDGRDAVSFRYGALRVEGEDLRDAVPLPGRDEWTDLADEAALHWIARSRDGRVERPLPPLSRDDEFLGYVMRTVVVDGCTVPSTKEALSIAGRIATALVAQASGRYVGDRPQAIRAYAEDVGGAWAEFLVELQETLRTRWRYRVPESAGDRAKLRELCERTLAFERAFVEELAGRQRGPRTERAWAEATTGKLAP